ncbi:lamin tail domain-containing protein [Halalkalibaculum sp. DA3122]|uniref:lamin tail domain-containing protein n=1 Tax=Halalkalibaculum sp. DA3122 TaxID=3373607 RepID=UPI003754F4C1
MNNFLATLLVVLLILLLPGQTSAQTTIIDETFSDGDFTADPAWTGSVDDHIIFDDQGNSKLRLDASGGGASYLTTESTAAYGTWEFLVEFDFNPSSTSYSRIYLLADQPELAEPVNGYYVRVGHTDDEVSLFRQTGTEQTKIIDGANDLIDHDPVAVRIKVTRDLEGHWKFLADSTGGNDFTSQGSARDNTHRFSNVFGIYSQYIGSRTSHYFYDDIQVRKVTPPLKIADIIPSENRIMDVVFNTRIAPNSVAAADFTLNNGIGTPSSARVTDLNTVRLTYSQPLPGGDYTLTVNNIDDAAGNTINTDSTIDFVLFDIFNQGDIAITEVMYDEPREQAEYIEITNRSSKRLNLEDWLIGDEQAMVSLSRDTLVIGAGDFLVFSSDTTALFNTYGSRNYVPVASLPAFNNGGDAVRIHTESGIRVDSLFYSPDWGGSEVALERRSTSTTAIYRSNWGDSPHPTGGTPGRPNTIPDDTMPPSVIEFNILEDQKLQLLFNERVDRRTAGAISRYSISGEIGFSGVQVSEPDTVLLLLDTPLKNASRYTLTISGVEDIFGNSQVSSNIDFTYYHISRADSGDIFINEFMYEPPEGGTEFVELYNPTQRSFDLQGWTLSDNTGNRKVLAYKPFVLPPDSFAVIAPDSTLASRYPGIHILTTGSRFPSLNNGGDDIVLRRPDGTLVDSLRYHSGWGGDKVSLERRTSRVPAYHQANWGDTPQGTGTPGTGNAIPPDTTPPKLSKFRIPDASTMKLVFSEPVSSESARNPSNYSVTPPVDIQMRSVAGDTVTLLLAEDLVSGTAYNITLSNLQDIFGNAMETVSRTREYLEFASAERGDIVINEILYHRSGASGPEFVELYNPGSEHYDLSGWQLGDGVAVTDLSRGIQLKAGEYVLLTGHKKFASTLDNGYYLSGFPSLNDDEDAIYIRSSQGTTIDSLYYKARWGGDEGISIERKDPLAASNDGSNWTSSGSPEGSSGGTKNSRFSPDRSPPGVLFSTRRPDGLIEVRFDEFIQLSPELTFMLEGKSLSVETFTPGNGNTILLQQPASGSSNPKPRELNIRNLADVKGNITRATSIPVAEPIEAGSVVINEIMYNPLNDPEDNQPDQREYIELRNTRDYAVSLEGFTLHDAPDETGATRSLIPVNSRAKFLPPQGHVLVYADEKDTFSDSQTALFFELDDLSPTRTVRIDRGTLSLASRDDAIYLADSTGATIDSVYYDESWHNPNIIDTRGVALERINPSGPSGSASNWSSSTTKKGGTPGTENSIYQVPGQPPDEIGISFNPNPFSPDGDGHEDNLFINYTLDHPNYLLKVRIFDRYGRLVRELADGKQAGYEGSLQWDGTTDDGNRNRVGIYIVLFEAYDSSNGSNRTFKEVVVLARQM